MKCSKCNSPYHAAFLCRTWGGKGGKDFVDKFKPYKPLRNESKKSHSKRMSTRRAWFENNPPDENGQWECYLQISSLCPKMLTKETLTMEHVRSKVRAPELKYNVDNIKPSCSFCNKMKQSRDLEELAKLWSHLEKYL